MFRICWFKKTCLENKCNIEEIKWKNKYYSHVIYEFEPTYSDDFEVFLTVSSSDKNSLDFVKYLYTEKLKTIEYFNTCLNN